MWQSILKSGNFSISQTILVQILSIISLISFLFWIPFLNADVTIRPKYAVQLFTVDSALKKRSTTAVNLTTFKFGKRIPNHRHQKLLPLPVESNFISGERQFGLLKHSNHKFYVWQAPKPSIGSVWPIPQHIKQDKRKICQLFYESHRFTINVAFKDHLNLTTRSPFFTFFSSNLHYVNSSILDAAVGRFRQKLSTGSGMLHVSEEDTYNFNLLSPIPMITKILITVRKKPNVEEWPRLHMDESYILRMADNQVIIDAEEVWGALCGLETLAQLLFMTPDKRIFLFSTHIRDRPRFPHRGLLIDTARHYIPTKILLRNLDAMAMNKLNVFHWHISDDQSFPFKGEHQPEMAERGAFSPQRIYTPQDVLFVINYARLRGIRVIPEFDVPSHTLSWAKSKNILTECYDGNHGSGYYGPIDPTLELTYKVLKNLYLDIQSLFVDKYLHLGADEVDTTCWYAHPQISEYQKNLKKLGVQSTLLQLLFQKLHGIIRDNSRTLKEKEERHFIIWQEGWEQQIPLPRDKTIVQLWMKNSIEALEVAREGNKIIFSTCYYLDRPVYGADWTQYYSCGLDMEYPLNPEANSWQANVLGGEACMWNEYQTSDTMTQRVWPSASAVAERLWSRNLRESINEAAKRLEAQRCRMISAGIQTGVGSGPAECVEHPVSKTNDFLHHLELENVAFALKRIAHEDPLVTSGFLFYLFILSLFFFIILFTFSHRRTLSATLPSVLTNSRRQWLLSHRGAFYILVAVCLCVVLYTINLVRHY